ncbi:hypothetical protein QUF72_12985 [Desulfobacterales bacterium HSG2]|nr:hypothetical protein [Desulfobacterales bacterium HSG2]
MKFKDDEWLTDYVNALHFTVRWFEGRQKERDVTNVCKTETRALIHEAILCNIPMEIFSIQRITERIDSAEADIGESGAESVQMETYKGDTLGLISDYAFLCKGFEEFTQDDMIEECSAYFAMIYPDMEDMRATITEIFNMDIESGAVEEIRSGIYRRVLKD